MNVQIPNQHPHHHHHSSKNDIKEIRTIKQLEKVDLDFDSPRLKKAMFNLGVSIEECIKKDRQDFEKRGLDSDVVTLRFKHYQSRLIDTLNRILEERKRIKLELQREEIRQGGGNINRGNVGTSQQFSLSAQMQSQGKVRSPSNMFLTAVTQKGFSKMQADQITSFDKSIVAMTQTQNLKAMPQIPQIQQPATVLNKTSGGFFLTQSPLFDDQMLNLDQELQKSMQSHRKQQHSVMLKVQDEFYRTQKDHQIQSKIERAQRMMQKQRKMDMKSRTQNNSLKRDEKIKQIKDQLEMSQRIENERETQRIMREQREREEIIKELENKKIEEMKRREQQFKERRYQQLRASLERNVQEQRATSLKLQEIEKRMDRSEEKLRQQLQEKVDRLQEKNKDLMDRKYRVRERNLSWWEEQVSNFHENEVKVNNRLRSFHKNMNKMWTTQKIKRKEQINNQTSRKADEELNRQQKLDLMLQKLQRSEKAVKDYMDDQRHGLMLKQELRKLREEDMKKMKERQKRLEFKKKMEILEKERDNDLVVRQIKEREQILIRKRYENRVKANQEKEQLRRTMDNWAHSGFTSARSIERNIASAGGNSRIIEFQQSLILSAKNSVGKKPANDDMSL